MSRWPWNLRLPEDAEKVVYRDQQIGWVWQTPMPYLRIDRSLYRVAKKIDRWTICMLDGVPVTSNSRTRAEAVRTLRRAIGRRVGGERVSNGRLAAPGATVS